MIRITLNEAINWGTEQLASTSDSAGVDSFVLLEFSTGYGKTDCYTHPDISLTPKETKQFQDAIEKRKNGIPVAYITGTKSFWNFSFKVTPHTLIPRPESELLVQFAIDKMDENNDKKTIVDLGTGSGCIGISIAKMLRNCQITATDISVQALEIAKENASQLNVENIEFIHSDWGEAIAHKSFDIIVSNPPYIVKNDPHLTQGDLRFEPPSALWVDENGLGAIIKILQYAQTNLNPEGVLAIEHGYHQGDEVEALFIQYGFDNIQRIKDITGIDRIMTAMKNYQ